jgi:hypothetical protein
MNPIELWTLMEFIAILSTYKVNHFTVVTKRKFIYSFSFMSCIEWRKMKTRYKIIGIVALFGAAQIYGAIGANQYGKTLDELASQPAEVSMLSAAQIMENHLTLNILMRYSPSEFGRYRAAKEHVKPESEKKENPYDFIKTGRRYFNLPQDKIHIK